MSISVLRWGGRAGIAAVCLFVAGTLLIAYLRSPSGPDGNQEPPPPIPESSDENQESTAPASDVPDENGPMLEQGSTERLAVIIRSIFSPLLFIGLLFAFQIWMQERGYGLAGWLYSIGVIGMSFWIISGIIRIFMLERISKFGTMLSGEETVFLPWIMAEDSFFDGSYLLLAIYSGIAGFILYRNGHRFIGIVGSLSGLTVMTFLLLNLYDDPNFLIFVYGYGIPIVWLFLLSALMLLRADSLDRTLDPKRTAPTA